MIKEGYLEKINRLLIVMITFDDTPTGLEAFYLPPVDSVSVLDYDEEDVFADG